MGVLEWLRGKRTGAAGGVSVEGRPASDEAAVAAGTTTFAAALYRELASGPGAIFFSPSSIDRRPALGELELRRGCRDAARMHLRAALDLARNGAERRFLEKRLRSCGDA